MPWVLRTENDVNNPTLAGGVYGVYITAGRGVYWRWDGTQTRGILFISDGGKYGLDSVATFEYKGAVLPETTNWIFHPGTYTAQIEPKIVTAINTTTSVLTSAGHGFSNGQLVRVGVNTGSLPPALSESLKYQIADVAGNDFKLKTEDGVSYINISDTTGLTTLRVWRANAGFDDPVQGLPTFCPEVETTFNNIGYVEFKLPSGSSTADTPPDWQDFRIAGIGRKLMNYDDTGAELGVESSVADNDPGLLSNVALQVVDNFLVNHKGSNDRIDWPSWETFRDDGETLIWQRVLATEDDTPTVTGWSGRYYTDQTFTNLYLTRNDLTINFPSSTVAPDPGMNLYSFSVRYTATIVPEFSELYTFRLTHDDRGKLIIDGQVLIDKGFFEENPSLATKQMVADQTYEVTVEIIQDSNPDPGNAWSAILEWSSASQAWEVIPASATTPQDEQVKRYECHTAFPIATEASEVMERLMERAPGYDWTDDEGLIKFLPPDRPIAFAFVFDKIDDDSEPNFTKNSFVKKRRPMAERKNFRLIKYRDVGLTGYPFKYVQVDRDELREYANGEPSNDPALEFGVSTRSLADRFGEMQMVMKSDPDHAVDIDGGRASSKIRKNHFVTVSYYDDDGNYVTDARYMVTFRSWGSKDGRTTFALLPIPDPFYTDEEV